MLSHIIQMTIRELNWRPKFGVIVKGHRNDSLEQVI